MPQRERERASERGREGGGYRSVPLPPLKTRPSLNDIVKIPARASPTPEASLGVSPLSNRGYRPCKAGKNTVSGCCYRLSFLQATAEPLSLCLCGAAILNPEATLMLQFRASYDLFLMPPRPRRCSLWFICCQLPLFLCLSLSSLRRSLSVSVCHSNCDTFCGIWYAEWLGGREEREEGGRDKNGINMSIRFMDLG